MRFQNSRLGRYALDALVIMVGCALFSFGIHVFTLPADIAPGGVTGIATIIHALTGLPIGTLVFLINIPLLILGFLHLGRKLMARTLFATAATSLFLDVGFVRLPVYEGDPMLASLFGGVLIGAGMALTFMREGTTGGTDILNRLIQKRHPQFAIGTLTFATDLVIILAACLVFGSVETGLYAIIAMFVASKVIDGMLYGLNERRMMLIVTEECDRLAARIMELQRGVTILDAKGAYTGAGKKVVLCVVAKSEYFRVRRIAHEVDPKAFLITANAAEVFGEGFQRFDGGS